MNKRSESRGKLALVIGGSISGLLAARVLSDFYENVVVIERDSLSAAAGSRRGVPHARHAHGLLASGTQVLKELFPEIMRDLLSAGAIPADVLDDARWFFEGGCLQRSPTGTKGVLVSRPVLESVVRNQVREIEGIEFYDNRTVQGLLFDGKVVKGVRTDAGVLETDLVVDTTGRGSRSPQWLKSIGFEPPLEERVEVQLTYTTRLFKRSPSDLGGDMIVAIPPTPDGKRGGVMLAQENGLWITTLYGYFGHQAPRD
ncbi:MAG: FAD-binding monooxygenase, partial [Saprospiraceae bacterium]|nr:FAD-binding monooxygenase [Pyrinomonadaceae bacterium]